MTPVRLFLDEDIYLAAAMALRTVGIDTLATTEVGRAGASDLDQLEWAIAHSRSIVTFNVAHFAQLHSTWMTQQRSHCGIIVSIQRPLGELVRRIRHLASTIDSAQMNNRLEFLSDW